MPWKSGKARCIAPKVASPLRKGQTVEVQRMAPEDACSGDMLVLIRWHGRTMERQLPCHNWLLLIPMTPLLRPLVTAITG